MKSCDQCVEISKTVQGIPWRWDLSRLVLPIMFLVFLGIFLALGVLSDPEKETRLFIIIFASACVIASFISVGYFAIPEHVRNGPKYELYLDNDGKFHIHLRSGPNCGVSKSEDMGVVYVGGHQIYNWTRLWLTVTTGGAFHKPQVSLHGYNPWPYCVNDTKLYRQTTSDPIGQGVTGYFDSDHWVVTMDDEFGITLDAGDQHTVTGTYQHILKILRDYRGKWEYKQSLVTT